MSEKDTDRYTTPKELLEVLRGEGFEQVVKFSYSKPLTPTEAEGAAQLHIWWSRKDFMMAVVEECFWGDYRENSVNRAHVYYNIKPNDMSEFVLNHASSGLRMGDIWVGHHTIHKRCSEKLKTIRNNGELIKWEHNPNVWFKHYMDERENEEIIQNVLALLPIEIKEGTCYFKDNRCQS